MTKIPVADLINIDNWEWPPLPEEMGQAACNDWIQQKGYFVFSSYDEKKIGQVLHFIEGIGKGIPITVTALATLEEFMELQAYGMKHYPRGYWNLEIPIDVDKLFFYKAKAE